MNKELIDKLEKEFKDLDMKIFNLSRFLISSDINNISDEQYRLLTIQESAMKTYLLTLRGRIELLKKEGESSEQTD